MRDMTPEPTAKLARSMRVNGTWPGYLGSGRLRTENERCDEDARHAAQVRERMACLTDCVGLARCSDAILFYVDVFWMSVGV